MLKNYTNILSIYPDRIKIGKIQKQPDFTKILFYKQQQVPIDESKCPDYYLNIEEKMLEINKVAAKSSNEPPSLICTWYFDNKGYLIYTGLFFFGTFYYIFLYIFIYLIRQNVLYQAH